MTVNCMRGKSFVAKSSAIGLCLTVAVFPAASTGQAGVQNGSVIRLVADKGVNLLPGPNLSEFEFRDDANRPGTTGSFTVVGSHAGRPIFRAFNPKGSANQHAVNAAWRSAAKVNIGDVMFIRFEARAIEARQESGEAEGLFSFRNAKGGESDFTQSFSIGPDWTVINAPFVAKADHEPGDGKMIIAFSNLPQTLEIRSFEAWNLGDRVPLSDLPITRFTYAGREPDAPWRMAALQRIEALRTAPITIKVVDRLSRPVSGAQVVAEMSRSDFIWGTAIDSKRIMDTGADGERYRREFLANFNMAVFENDLKWPRWRDASTRPRTMQALDWLTSKNILVKGHNLAWPAWKFTPTDIAQDPKRCEKIEALADAHVRELTSTFKGRLIGWDVVNEPIHETDYWKCMPPEKVVDWFKIAEAADPKMQLTLNEYAMLNRSSSPLMIAKFLDYSRMLRKQGARIDVLGVQGHVGQTPRPPIGVLADLDLLAVDGQQVQITEFDFNTRDEELQADYTRDFLIALYSHKAVTGIIKWGFWEKAHWKPAAAMYASDWRAKPNREVWRKLVLGDWRTRVNARTDASGTVRSKGHLGTYRILVRANGRSKQVDSWKLAKGSSQVVVRLD